MSLRRETELRLHSLSEISSIMNSMKTLALIETRKLSRFLVGQQRAVTEIERVAADFSHFYPRPRPEDGYPVRVLLGSERGFCGDFNEALLRDLDAPARLSDEAPPRFVAIGRKLGLKLEDDPRVAKFLDGPNVAEEVDDVMIRLIDTVNELQTEHGPIDLTVLHRDSEAESVRIRQVLPPFQAPARENVRFTHPPLLNLSPQVFFAELLDHYLFAVLYEMLYTSLLAENYRRMRHLEGALTRIEEETSALSLQRNRARQEEITQEIEVIMLSVEAMLD